MKGYVYVFSNPPIPGLLKIGHSSKDPEERAAKLSEDTGVPEPYVVEYEAHVNDPEMYERRVHQRLKDVRPNKNREFFECSLDEAIIAIKNELGSGLIYDKYHKDIREEVVDKMIADRKAKAQAAADAEAAIEREKMAALQPLLISMGVNREKVMKGSLKDLEGWMETVSLQRDREELQRQANVVAEQRRKSGRETREKTHRIGFWIGFVVTLIGALGIAAEIEQKYGHGFLDMVAFAVVFTGGIFLFSKIFPGSPDGF